MARVLDVTAPAAILADVIWASSILAVVTAPSASSTVSTTPAARVVSSVTLPVPSKDIADAVTSPEIEKSLGFVN